MSKRANHATGRQIAWLIGVLLAGSATAASRQVAYFIPVAKGYFDAQLVTWKGADRARVVRLDGAMWGHVSTDGAQKLVTLDAPLSRIDYAQELDSCGNQPQVRRDLKQVVYRNVSGSKKQGQAEIVDIGTNTILDGCDAGQVTTFGSPSDPGTPESFLDLAERPPLTDLVTGLSLAGFSEKPFDGLG